MTPQRNLPHFCIILAVLWLAVNISSSWYPTPDACGYLSIARELAHEGRFRNLDSPLLYYPIGYSLLLTPLFWLDSEPFLFISMVHCFLALLLLRLVYVWVKQHFPAHATWITLATVGSVSFGNVYRRTLSETLFMLLLFGTGLAFQRVVREGKGRIAPAGLFVLLVLVRPAGAMLAPAYFVALAFSAKQKRRTWKAAMALSLLVLPAAGVQVGKMMWDREAAAKLGKPTYSEQVRDANRSVPEQVVEGVRLRVQEAGRLLVPGMYKAYAREGQWLNVNMLLYVPIAVGLCWGWWRLVVRCGPHSRPFFQKGREDNEKHPAADAARLLDRFHEPSGVSRRVNRERSEPGEGQTQATWKNDVLLWALPFYVALHVIWPFDQSTRFFTPIMPILLVCWLGLPWKTSERFQVRAGYVFAILHLLVALGYWLFSERPANLALEARVPVLRQMVNEIPAEERNLVGISSTCGDEHPWLQFLLNREVRIWNVKQSSDPPKEVQWLVIHEKDTPPPGFVQHDRNARLFRQHRTNE